MSGHHFDTSLQQTWPKTIFGLGRAAHTVFTTPPTSGHDETIYIEVAKRLRGTSIPLQPSLDEELAKLSRVTMKSGVALEPKRRLNNREQLGIMGILMQFTSYIPDLRPYCLTPFDDTEGLYKAFVNRSNKTPLDFAQQLDIALEQTSGDVLEALWRLFITCRLYARWFDASVIVGMPKFGRSEILHRMELFSQAVAACKSSGTMDQDTSGDAYYTWTHALAKVLYKVCAMPASPIAPLEGLALHNGTRLNHKLAHKYKPQRLKSDHTIAAAYGNAIGKLLVER
ncbi:MAG TPA: hypothetical protein VIM53_01260 [Candidatus Saccharimonadales bacterium]